MPSDCVRLVERLRKELVKVLDLSSQSTVATKYLTSQVLFIPWLPTAKPQLGLSYSQSFIGFWYLFLLMLSPFPTAPNNEDV